MIWQLSIAQDGHFMEFDLPDNLATEEVREAMKKKVLDTVRWNYRIKGA